VKFEFRLRRQHPVFSISPNHARMATCYKDAAGVYHLFVDYVDASLKTIHSFQSEVRQYDSVDLFHWEFVSTAVARGKYRGTPESSDPDCYGAASPHILCVDGEAWLFYAGRGPLDPSAGWSGYAEPGESGYVPSQIMLSVAPLDANGAPAGPFKKRGIVVRNNRDWKRMRVDDPCAVKHAGKLHLYFKAFPSNRDRDMCKLGHACLPLGEAIWLEQDSPVFSVRGGLEMPRVFRYGNGWHMFLRHFDHEQGFWWRHYTSDDGISWSLYDPKLFDGAGPEPGAGAKDMMLVYDLSGGFSGMALATGLLDGFLCLWLYDVVDAQ
jgi:hypothetical protein